MLTIKKPLLLLTLVCIASLALLDGCGTPIKPDVGEVVVAPQVQTLPPPVIVQVTEPMPVGYFQQTLADYFSGSPKAPMTSTSPISPAGPTPSQ